MRLDDREYERLISYAAGELTPQESCEIEALLRVDAEAAATVARFRKTTEAARTDRSEAPPTATLAAAKALYRSAPAAPSLFERLRRVLADLSYDSRAQVALVGVRGASASYQLSYESAVGGIDVQIEPTGAADDPSRRLIGQVTLNDEQEFGRVVVTAPGSEVGIATATIDAGGVFTLTATTGSFDLWIALADTVLVVPGVEIR